MEPAAGVTTDAFGLAAALSYPILHRPAVSRRVASCDAMSGDGGRDGARVSVRPRVSRGHP